MSYDAANYDHYAKEADKLDQKKHLILAALPESGAQQEGNYFDAHFEGEILRHSASGSIAIRALAGAAPLDAFGPINPLAVRRIPLGQGPAQIALFVTKQSDSPLAVLEWCRNNPEKAKVCAVVSTNCSLEWLAKTYNVPFFVGGEARLHAPEFFASVGLSPDLIVLARYMRVLPPEMVARHAGNIINVHHSLLPAFIGANTYERALERGVRVMGATAHYVTEQLDEGPIICQKAFDVDPAMSLEDLKKRGAQFEAAALREAVAAHVEHRLLKVGRHVVHFPPRQADFSETTL